MDVREKLVEQKIKGGAESICAKCFHNKVCKAMDNQPCIECNQFVNSHGVTVRECKLGEKIYQTDGARIYESTISEITLTAKHTIFVTENIAFDERAIGRSVFLTKEEAEAHLYRPPKGE